jgi:hypothetical protein
MNEWGSAVSGVVIGAGALGAVCGIFGTVLGAVIANANARKLAAAQREHEDRKRFHEQRLKIYAEILESLHVLTVADLKVYHAKQTAVLPQFDPTKSLSAAATESASRADRDAWEKKVVQGLFTVSLISTKSVRDAGEQLRFALLGQMEIYISQNPSKADYDRISTVTRKAEAAFTEATRQELS